MRVVIRGARAALFLALIGGPAERASAQWTPTLWADLVQMPVAVARLELAGVPLADLSLVVPALNVRTVAPTRFLESLRGISILDGWGFEGLRDERDGPGMGPYVQAMHARGLRGPALADAIHDELRARGVPAGPKRARKAGTDVFARAFTVIRSGERGRTNPDHAEGRGSGNGNARGTAAPGRGNGNGRGPAARGGGNGNGRGTAASGRGNGNGRGSVSPRRGNGRGNAPASGGRGRGGRGPRGW